MGERTGSLLVQTAGGRLGNRSQRAPFGFSPPPDGNSKAGRTHQIWHWGGVEQGQKNRAVSFSFN